MSSTATRDGREQVVTLLFRRHCAELVRLAYCLLGDRTRAEEAVQEAFVSLFRNWPLQDEESALGYLRVGVVNRCRSDQRRTVLVRRRDPLVTAEARWALVGPDAADDVLTRDEANRVAAQVRGLPRRQREVIVCRYYLELSERETAELLAIGTGSVKRHAHRGLATLRARLGGSR